ncbi:hypothetical protein K474DRAFT_1657631 [Panus rudis PR-1116 ss-1]|nr:hypothetical protein K474DRAFT_1657631 [Panus rudis PR-1116 ss-1]
MPTLIPTVQQIEDYLESLEELIYSSLSAATPDLPNVREAINRLWEDVSRFGPQALPPLPEIHIPGLGTFEVPPPPPPPPPPKSLWEKSADWAVEHKWATISIGLGILGLGVLGSYTAIQWKGSVRSRKNLRAKASSNERKQVVVVLGGDSAFGTPLVSDLEAKGYIVIATVSTPEAAEKIESLSHGYVRALVVNPLEPEWIITFIRSVSSTLSRRFPISAAGDPHAPPSTRVYIQSVISLLTLPSSNNSVSTPVPLERLSPPSYNQCVQDTHLTPLLLLQCILPFLRVTPFRSLDNLANNVARKSIVVCVPAAHARVGLPFLGQEAIAGAANLRMVDVLRRELKAASLSSGGGSFKDLKVVTVDVGSTDIGEWLPPPVDDKPRLNAYEPALRGLVGSSPAALRRTWTSPAVLSHAILKVIQDGRSGNDDVSAWELASRKWARFVEWLNGDHVVVGPGARTYFLASMLPTRILDLLLVTPWYLFHLRERLTSIQSQSQTYRLPTKPTAAAPPAQSTSMVVALSKPAQSQTVSPIDSDPDVHTDSSSEADAADIESLTNSGYGSGVGESWVNVKDKGAVRDHSPA